jgi:hypothetical protein
MGVRLSRSRRLAAISSLPKCTADAQRLLDSMLSPWLLPPVLASPPSPVTESKNSNGREAHRDDTFKRCWSRSVCPVEKSIQISLFQFQGIMIASKITSTHLHP